MGKFLFKNRWFAAIWVLATLVSVSTFVAEGGGTDKIEKAAADLKAQGERAQKPSAPHVFVIEGDADEVDENGFTRDEHLNKEARNLGEEAADGLVPVSEEVLIEN
jgi:hypothetical protein